MKNWINRIPKLVLDKVKASGKTGVEWLESLDHLIYVLEKRWEIEVIKVHEGGTHAFIGEAITQGNKRVILKLSMPEMIGETEFENEIKALELADGNGYVQLLQYDLSCGAALLEQLGKPLKSLNLPVDNQIEIICNTLRKSWIEIPNGTNLQDGKEICSFFSNLFDGLYKEFSTLISRKTMDKVLMVCGSRLDAFTPEKSVLVHGDPHNANILQDLYSNEFKLIDPDGIYCEPAYDLGILMREWPDELIDNPIVLGEKRCELLSNLTNVESQLIWEWGLIQCVATGLLLVKTGQKQEGIKLLKIAESWAERF